MQAFSIKKIDRLLEFGQSASPDRRATIPPFPLPPFFVAEAFWLARATNYPIPICYAALLLKEFNEEAAENWLNAQAAAHGYNKKDSPLPRSIIGYLGNKYDWPTISSCHLLFT